MQWCGATAWCSCSSPAGCISKQRLQVQRFVSVHSSWAVHSRKQILEQFLVHVQEARATATATKTACSPLTVGHLVSRWCRNHRFMFLFRFVLAAKQGEAMLLLCMGCWLNCCLRRRRDNSRHHCWCLCIHSRRFCLCCCFLAEQPHGAAAAASSLVS